MPSRNFTKCASEACRRNALLQFFSQFNSSWLTKAETQHRDPTTKYFFDRLFRGPHLHEQDVSACVAAVVHDEGLLADVTTAARLQVDGHAAQVGQIVQKLIDVGTVGQPDVGLSQKATHLPEVAKMQWRDGCLETALLE